MDYSQYEGADILFDRNSEKMPEELEERFDIIIDGGVLEHIFHPGIAIRNIAAMVRTGGIIYHAVPCGGFVNHGFYSFSPTFFQDFYNREEYQIESLRMQYKPERGFKKFVFYSMDCRLFQCADGFNQYISRYWNKGGEILLQCIVHKIGKSDYIELCRPPIQGMYQKIYKELL